MEPIIETKHLTHTYSAGTPFERTALDSVDFAAYPGEYLGIIGHTGSGKSTLIQHLNGLLKPTGGQVLFQGTDIWSDPKITRRTRFQVGLVFQYPEYQLFEETVYKDISFGPRNMGLSEKEIDRRVRSAAYFVGLRDDQLEKSPFELSGGQKRRVAIAGVIAMEPRVLILDEPTAGLDPEGVDSILGNIRDYHKANNATIILYLGEEKPDDPCTVPNVIGKSASEANKAITNAGLIMKVTGATSSSSGNVFAISQSVAAGTEVEAGTVVTVQLGDNSVLD